jgi:hypothetical protein
MAMRRPIDGNDSYAVLLAELAGRLRLPALAPDAWGTCAIRFGGALTVNLRPGWDDPDTLWLVCSLGAIEPDAATCAALLRGNLPWRQAQGATLGLSDESPPRVLLSRSLRWRGLDGAGLAASLEDFVAAAHSWQQRLAQPPGGHQDPATAGRAPHARERDGLAAWVRA